MLEDNVLHGFLDKLATDAMKEIEREPKSLFDQLNENGKLIAVIRPVNMKIGKAKIFFKKNNEIGMENLFDAQVSKLSIFKSNSKFSF